MLRNILMQNFRSLVKTSCRQCSSQSKPSINVSNISSNDATIPISKIPLSEPVPWLPRPIYATPSESQKEAKITTLSNGVRVASQQKFGKFCTVGVLIDSGSRYEVAFPSGISHFLEKLAFGSTRNMSREDVMRSFEKMGGICDCQSSRDTLIYATSVETTGLENSIKILGDVILRPLLTDEEIMEARMSVSFDLEALQMRPEKDAILMEMIHSAAYRDNTVGLPKITPAENVNSIDRDVLLTYLRAHHCPSRMVLAGVGVDHDQFVDLAQRYFVDELPIWDEKSSGGKRSIQPDTSHAQYSGGVTQEEMDLSEVSLGPNPLPELAHMVLGLESMGHQHEDFVTCCVLNMIMGGGGSFSAGGPGKGMYTRLYTNVLNRYHWMHSATALNHAYIDSGLFCIHASAHPSHLADLVQVLTREFVAMTTQITEEEFMRAKTQLQSMLLMNLESRPVVFEDMGRQVLATGVSRSPEYFTDLIEKVSPSDITRVASEMLKSKPSVAALGSLRLLPPVADIEAALLDRDGRMPAKSRFSLFR